MTPDDDVTRVAGHLVQIVGHATDDCEVWLNTEVQPFDGLCIGAGRTRRDAVRDAIQTLEAVTAYLQQRMT